MRAVCRLWAAEGAGAPSFLRPRSRRLFAPADESRSRAAVAAGSGILYTEERVSGFGGDVRRCVKQKWMGVA